MRMGSQGAQGKKEGKKAGKRQGGKKESWRKGRNKGKKEERRKKETILVTVQAQEAIDKASALAPGSLFRAPS